MQIAKAAIFNILNSNTSSSNTVIDNSDMELNIRIGFMHYKGSNCAEANGTWNYSSGCNTLVNAIDNGTVNGTTYAKIYCGATATSTDTDTDTNPTCSSPTDNTHSAGIVNETAIGGTPLAASLQEALLYMKYLDTNDSAKSCRKKFVLIVTDGEDTYGCNGDGSASQTNMNWRRSLSVASARDLMNSGYQVFVIGFGSNQSTTLQNTLNWMAYYGSISNASGTYVPPATSSVCSSSNTGDPGTVTLSGYAYIATDTSSLLSALKAIINKISMGNYSFSQPYIASQRTSDENYIYQASFEPQSNPNDPLWIGHLMQYGISTSTYAVSSTANWDSETAVANSYSSRNIYTYVGGGVISLFDDSGVITPTTLGLASTDTDNLTMIRQYIRGDVNPDAWKFGDIFHSNLAIIGTPSSSFYDTLDQNSPTGYASFRSAHPRTTAAATRVILAGANDGQLHAFKTSDGSEAWSFIPPSSLPNLQLIAHTSTTTNLTHTYFVDGPVTTSDVWFGSNSAAKSSSEWHTYAVFGLGQGNPSQLWSDSDKCDGNGGFSETYGTYSPYYCGYYALDLTSSPSSQIDSFAWILKTNTGNGSAAAPYLGQPWSKMGIGRVKIGGSEKWVGFIGAGYNSVNCAGSSACDNRGKGVLVVDMSDGSVIRAFTKSTNSDMLYSLPAAPAKIDSDYDAFLDRVYIGDLGGNLWRLKMCASSDDSSCVAGSWTMSKLYDNSSSSTKLPIYTKPAVTKDSAGNIWVYWGTGDKQNPTSSSSGGALYAIIDGGSTYTSSNLTSVSSSVLYSGTTQGWIYSLSGAGEKMLGDVEIYAGKVYFTTFTPTGTDICTSTGTSKLYTLDYITGSASITTLSGSGIASSPTISISPDGTANLYVSVSGSGSVSATISNPVNPTQKLGVPSIRYWRDLRVQ
jgi:type IV pilus assembly protein PilY1